MSEQKFPLPVGSVVQVKGSDQKFMITSQLPVAEIEGKKGYFNFGAATLPLGRYNQEMIFFNSEDVDEIIYLGYVDANFQEFTNNYEKILATIQYENLKNSISDNNDEDNLEEFVF